MTKKERYIAYKRGRASAYRDASSYVPADCTRDGLNVRETFLKYARANDQDADCAALMTTQEFRSTGVTS